MARLITFVHREFHLLDAPFPWFPRQASINRHRPCSANPQIVFGALGIACFVLSARVVRKIGSCLDSCWFQALQLHISLLHHGAIFSPQILQRQLAWHRVRPLANLQWIRCWLSSASSVHPFTSLQRRDKCTSNTSLWAVKNQLHT